MVSFKNQKKIKLIFQKRSKRENIFFYLLIVLLFKSTNAKSITLNKIKEQGFTNIIELILTNIYEIS